MTQTDAAGDDLYVIQQLMRDLCSTSRTKVKLVKSVIRRENDGQADSTCRRNTLVMEVFMGRPAGWMQKLTGRGAMRSPGALSLRREIERRFWEQIATGITSESESESESAADAVGVSQAVGTRWFRHRGGMPFFMSSPISGRYLSFAEREDGG